VKFRGIQIPIIFEIPFDLDGGGADANYG